MKLNHIHIDAFGKFRDLRLEFSDGINIIYGRNEAGKTTLHAFLMAMFFGLSEKPGRLGREQSYERYKSWGDESVYGGELSFDHEGREFILRRDFMKGPADLSITRDDGTKVPEPEAFLSEALLSLTESAFKNTISVGQLKAAAGRELIRELKSYINNLSSTGNPELSADGAIAILDKKREQLLKGLETDAVKDYAALVGRIKNLEAELSSPESDNVLSEFYELKDEVDGELSDNQSKLTELRDRRERAKELLSENGFTDRRSIDDMEEELKAGYETYQRHRKKSANIFKTVVPVIFLLISFGLAACAFLISELSAYAFYGLIGTALASLIIAVVLVFLHGREKKQVRREEEELSERLEKQLGDKTVGDEALEKLHERLEGFRRLYDTDVSTITEETSISDKIIELSKKQSDYQADIYRQQDTNRKVEDKLILLNELRNRSLELRNTIAENNRIKEDIDAIDMAKENLSELSSELRSSTGAYINREAGEILGEVTGGTYSRIELTEGMDIYINKKGQSIPAKALSMGTIDQIYLSIRLAAIRLVEGGREDGRLPVFFDDSFTLYDDERLWAALSFIAGHFKGQILLFTCQHREENMLLKAGIGHNYIELT
ncbi:MAG TPA: AAA family ATPase [Candidatus Avilachnospira avistercoris]|nr:AAA family ATPase [Candidatus Avilachnospira avistercoris]